MKLHKNHSPKSLEGTITTDDLLGKDVIDTEGRFIGISEKAHLDARTIELIGITVDKGFFQPGLIIGKRYIDRVTPHAIFLNIRPAVLLRNLEVFDINGKKVGIVQEVIQHGRKNELEKLIIKNGILKKPLEITPEQIKDIGKNILLNVKEEELHTD